MRGLMFITLLLALTVAIIFCGWVFLQRIDRIYAGNIYPNVYLLGVELGGMTPEEATIALSQIEAQANTGLLVLSDGEQRWIHPWAEAGIQIDVPASVEEAYSAGRSGEWREQLALWFGYQTIAPKFTFNAETARSLINDVAAEASQPMADPTIQLENGEVVIIPGKPGRVVNVTQTLAQINNASSGIYNAGAANPQPWIEVPLIFEIVEPATPDTTGVKVQAETFLSKTLTIMAYDVISAETLTWETDRGTIASWLYLVTGENGEALVDVNRYQVQETLVNMAAEFEDGRGFRLDEATQQVFDAFINDQSEVYIYLTHPERTYEVEAGDTLTSLSAKFGMPPGLVAEANTDIDINHLSVGQVIKIPSADVLTPYIPVPGKKIMINIAEQRMRVYENDALLHEWSVSTGIKDSPTHKGIFQVVDKNEKAYGSQWDLWMPYFIAIYPAGGDVYNGIHELPILSNGQRLWEGSLGSPASFGCIILGIPEAETLYNWADIGVLVIIE